MTAPDANARRGPGTAPGAVPVVGLVVIGSSVMVAGNKNRL